MKKYFFLLVLGTLVTLASMGQSSKCRDLRNGDFKTVSESGTTLVTRKGSVQTEVNEQARFRGEFHVKWLDDCVYTLQPRKIYSKGTILKIDYEEILTIRIIDVTGEYYTIEATSNKREGVVKGKVYIIN